MPQTTSHSKSWLGIVGILLGGLGIALCIAAMVMLGIVSARLGRATDHVFGSLDQSLVAVRERVDQTQQRLQAAKITADDVDKSLRDWTVREAGQRVAEQLNVAERTERLAAMLQQADDWLDIAASSAAIVKEVLSMGELTQPWANAPSIDRLVEELAAVRAQLAEAMDVVTTIRARIDTVGEQASSAERLQQAAQFAVRLAATLGMLDSRLDTFGVRLSTTQSELQQLQSKTQWWLRFATIGVALVILLMAAGQVAMCRLAWNAVHESREQAA